MELQEVDLSGFAGDTIVLRWSATKGNGSQGDIAIDEVVVEDQPLCPDPSNFDDGCNINNCHVYLDYWWFYNLEFGNWEQQAFHLRLAA